MMNRRKLIEESSKLIIGASAFSIYPNHIIAQDINKKLYANCYMKNNKYGCLVFDSYGKEILDISLPERGHAVSCAHHSKKIIICARRPGQFAYIIDLNKSTDQIKITPPRGVVFNGHAVFSDCDQHIYVSENSYKKKQGQIGVYTLNKDGNWKRSKEFLSRGIGCHEIILNQGNLWVANGGVLTHPKTGRKKQNLNSIESNLTCINTKNGNILKKIELNHSMNNHSLRHIALNPNNPLKIIIGAQNYSNEKLANDNLIIQAGPHKKQLIHFNLISTIKPYIGSVTYDNTGLFSAFSNPKSSKIIFCSNSASEFKIKHIFHQQDICGVATSNKKAEFFATSGDGRFIRFDLENNKKTIIKKFDLQFDNHLCFIG